MRIRGKYPELNALRAGTLEEGLRGEVADSTSEECEGQRYGMPSVMIRVTSEVQGVTSEARSDVRGKE